MSEHVSIRRGAVETLGVVVAFMVFGTLCHLAIVPAIDFHRTHPTAFGAVCAALVCVPVAWVVGAHRARRRLFAQLRGWNGRILNR